MNDSRSVSWVEQCAGEAPFTEAIPDRLDKAATFLRDELLLSVSELSRQDGVPGATDANNAILNLAEVIEDYTAFLRTRIDGYNRRTKIPTYGTLSDPESYSYHALVFAKAQAGDHDLALQMSLRSFDDVMEQLDGAHLNRTFGALLRDQVREFHFLFDPACVEADKLESAMLVPTLTRSQAPGR